MGVVIVGSESRGGRSRLRSGIATKPGATGRAPAPEHRRDKRITPVSAGRATGLKLIMGLCFAIVISRLVFVQVAASDRYAAIGESELLHHVSLPASRGSILDRNGNILAMSIPQATIVADPHQITDPRTSANLLAPILGRDPAAVQKQLSKDSHFVYLARQVDDNVAARAKALKLAGISFVSEPKRFLADAEQTASVIGTVGIDGQGLGGIEYRYDKMLAGQPGDVVVERDPRGHDIPGGRRSSKPAITGRGIVLTLDQPLQYEMQQALSDEIVASHASSGRAIVMDTRTGEVLAMASLVAGKGTATPTPAPNNAALTEVYEPGSVMKEAVVAGALDGHVVSPDQWFTVPGQLTLYGSVFHDAEAHGTESLSLAGILAQSSNIGAIEIARDLGPDRLYYFMRDFGYGVPTGLGFPGESAGLLRPPSQWSGTSIAAVAIGQDQAATPLQVLDAFAAIASGGVSVVPRLVEASIGADGKRRPFVGARGRRVVSAATAATMTQMLEQVVQPSSGGTAPAAAIPGYTVAGKTGTAQIPLPSGRGYEPGAYMATFVGYAPAESPALAAIVVLERPTPIFGGEVAAPAFSQIMRYALRRFDVLPGGTASGQATVPGVSG